MSLAAQTFWNLFTQPRWQEEHLGSCHGRGNRMSRETWKTAQLHNQLPVGLSGPDFWPLTNKVMRLVVLSKLTASTPTSSIPGTTPPRSLGWTQSWGTAADSSAPHGLSYPAASWSHVRGLTPLPFLGSTLDWSKTSRREI